MDHTTYHWVRKTAPKSRLPPCLLTKRLGAYVLPYTPMKSLVIQPPPIPRGHHRRETIHKLLKSTSKELFFPLVLKGSLGVEGGR